MSDEDYVLPRVDDLIQNLHEFYPGLGEIGISLTVACILDGANLMLTAYMDRNHLLESVSRVEDYGLTDIFL